MRSRNVIVCVLLGTLVLVTVGYEHGGAAQSQVAPAKIAVVSVDRILENSKKHLAWQQKMTGEQDEMRGELQKMQKEIEAVQADLNTRKAGTSDYLRLMQDYMEKQAELEAREKFYEQQMTMKIQQWTEQLYQDIRSVTSDVANRKGLDLVVARDEMRFPSPSLRDLMLTIKTSTVLYSRQEMDITDDVLAALDAGL